VISVLWPCTYSVLEMVVDVFLVHSPPSIFVSLGRIQASSFNSLDSTPSSSLKFCCLSKYYQYRTPDFLDIFCRISTHTKFLRRLDVANPCYTLRSRRACSRWESPRWYCSLRVGYMARRSGMPICQPNGPLFTFVSTDGTSSDTCSTRTRPSEHSTCASTSDDHPYSLDYRCSNTSPLSLWPALSQRCLCQCNV
jgi:hypothetical protein